MIEGRRAEFASWSEAAEADAQDGHWLWREKATAALRLMGKDSYSVECDGQTQGLMLVDSTKFARLEVQKGRDLVYIELLATAPWNRTNLIANARFKGVGRVLVSEALSLSFDLGSRGRLGLHSLAGSESWYRDVAGFTDVAFDADKGMRYFEATEAQAAAFFAD